MSVSKTVDANAIMSFEKPETSSVQARCGAARQPKCRASSLK